MTTGPVVALDVGGTSIRGALVDEGGIGEVVSRPTPATAGAAAVVNVVAQVVEELLPGQPLGIGIATAGVVDETTGAIVSATDLIRGWAGTDLGKELAARTRLEVRVINDVHAHALGEFHHGAGRGSSSMLLVAVGTGLGGGLVVNDRLVRGRHGVAGHLGHIPSAQAQGMACSCGATGHLEAVASGSGLAALYGRGRPAVSARQVVARAESGEPWARQCLAIAATSLGEALGGWVNTFDPDLVVVSGGLAQAGALWWDAMLDSTRSTCLGFLADTPIVTAEHPDWAGLLGAATLFPNPASTHSGGSDEHSA